MKNQMIKSGIRVLGSLLLAFYPAEADSLYEVHKTAAEPVIDGMMDDVWHNTPGTSMLKTHYQVPNSWADLSCIFRTLWDDDNFYVFLQINDQTLRSDWSDAYSHEDDGFELFFDADNSKGTSFDQINDVQLRINHAWGHAYHVETGFGNPRVDWGFSDNGLAYWMQDTEYGYDFEVKIPLDAVKIPNVPGHMFGLEVQVNDNDTGEREQILKWWSESNDSWINPSLFATAVLSDDEVSGTLQIPFTEEAPAIDGNPDDAWAAASLITLNHYTRLETIPVSWTDMGGSARLMWDQTMLYLFCTAVDQSRRNDGGNAWDNDGFEFYVDGNYSHGQNYDGVDDTQYIFNWNSNTVSIVQGALNTSGFQFAQVNTADGWQAEIAMPLNSIHVQGTDGTVFGMELSYNDDDNGGIRDHQMHYWDADDMTWMHPNTFAPVTFTGGPELPVVYGDVDQNSRIQAYDASVILKSLTGLLELTEAQTANADVSLDGSVSALDASLILQYRVGLIDHLPYAGLPKSSGPAGPVVFGGPFIAGNTVEIPLHFSETTSLRGLECTLDYDNEALQFERVVWADGFRTALKQINTEGNLLKMACAFGARENDLSDVASLWFTLGGSSGKIRMNASRVDENPVNRDGSALLIPAPAAELPEVCRLNPNYPNPFNPVTAVSYELPEACEVTLTVYNLAGQAVTTLVRSHQSAGRFTVLWNAAESPAGIYVIRLQAGSACFIRKMSLVK